MRGWGEGGAATAAEARYFGPQPPASTLKAPYVWRKIGYFRPGSTLLLLRKYPTSSGEVPYFLCGSTLFLTKKYPTFFRKYPTSPAEVPSPGDAWHGRSPRRGSQRQMAARSRVGSGWTTPTCPPPSPPTTPPRGRDPRRSSAFYLQTQGETSVLSGTLEVSDFAAGLKAPSRWSPGRCR
jgi:hypothetical protein